MESSGLGNTIIGADTVTQAGHAVEGEAAPQAPQAPQLSPSQEKSAAIVKEIMQRGGREKLSERDMARLREHHAWKDGLPNAREPLENRIEAAPDHRPADGVRDEFEKQHAPITEQQRSYFEQRAKLNGASPQWAEAISWTVSGLQLPEAESRTIVDRFAKHAAAGMVGESFNKLTDAEHAELADEAIRLCNGREKLETYMAGAKAYLARFPDVEAALTKHGAFDSSLAYDVRLLMTLHHANEYRKVSRR